MVIVGRRIYIINARHVLFRKINFSLPVDYVINIADLIKRIFNVVYAYNIGLCEACTSVCVRLLIVY